MKHSVIHWRIFLQKYYPFAINIYQATKKTILHFVDDIVNKKVRFSPMMCVFGPYGIKVQNRGFYAW